MNYVCKIATLDEIIQKFDYEISIHKDKKRWNFWKEEAKRLYLDKKRITYILLKDEKIIGEAHAAISKDACQNSNMLIDDDTAYLFAFRINEEERGKHLFTKLYEFIENDLKKRGYKKLTLGVEAEGEVGKKNLEIYKHFGFSEFIKTAYEEEPEEDGKKELTKVDYYLKKL